MQAPLPSPAPWWKFAHVWMVIAGPVLVVIAAVFTAYLAMSAPDPVLTRDSDRANLAPALQARNHAQTGVPAQD